MKICTKCKKEKEVCEFDKKGSGLSSHCKDCRKEYVKSHYNKNRDYYILKAKRHNLMYTQEYNEYKESLFCNDCNLSFKDKPYLCDFHHVDSDKEYSVSTLSTSRRLRLEELKKCVPLCANCHRERHNGDIV